MGQKITATKINKMHEDAVNNSEKIQQINSAIIELLKLEFKEREIELKAQVEAMRAELNQTQEREVIYE
jgi:hypothetical protein